MQAAGRIRGWAPYATALAVCLLVAWAAYEAVFSAQLTRDKAAAGARLEFFTLSLESLLARNEALPGLLALERKLGAALDREAGAAQPANRYLEAVARGAGISAAYLMDVRGLTLAASNWDQPVSFVGQNYAFRPYVQDALAGRPGRFYAIGATTGEAGYFLASRVQSPGGATGVIAVKVSLEPFEDALKQSGEDVMVVDRHGVVVLGSDAGWKYKTLQPLEREDRERLARTRQYGEQPLPPLPRQADYSIVRRPVAGQGWQMLMLTDRRPARATGAVAAIAAFALSAFVLGLVLHLRLTREQREANRRAERALQQVGAELERKSAELKRTDAILHETRDAAVQAGKLTMLGQMSAGMTHELNQPLAALRTLSDNAVNLLEQERVGEARENLALIAQLTDRLGRIVNQLKTFARKEAAETGPVQAARAVEHALIIVEPKRRETGARIDTSGVDPALCVRAEAVRLEQVLVNLLRNALDAVADQPVKDLQVVAGCDEGGALIAVRDSGPGIPAAALERLFEPFHTTKPSGQGLGLGLALSLAIVEGFGGKLEGRNLDSGGAEFSVRLALA